LQFKSICVCFFGTRLPTARSWKRGGASTCCHVCFIRNLPRFMAKNAIELH
jgi:hypothetical protein